MPWARTLLILLLLPLSAAQAQIALPAPEGAASVGVWEGELETGREDTLTPRAGDRRRLAVSIWFPADPDTGTAKPWASAAMGAALSRQFPFPAGFEQGVTGHARLGASPAGDDLPIVIFSPGLSFPPALYQSFFEDLASRGYVVAAVSHPHGVSLIEYSDGTTLDMAAWPRFPSQPEREAFLARHAAVWTDDLRDVLDWISAGAPGTPVSTRLDLGRIALLGHSYGGTAAARLSADPRAKAVVLMEGLVRDPDNPQFRGSLVAGAPLLHLIGGYNRVEFVGAQYRPGEGAPVYQAVVNGTGHANFSDLIYLYRRHADADWHRRHRYELDPGRVLQISRDYIAAFLDRYLNGAEPATLLRPFPYAAASPSVGGYPEIDLTISTR